MEIDSTQSSFAPATLFPEGTEEPPKTKDLSPFDTVP